MEFLPLFLLSLGVFLFFPPLVIILPSVCSFSHPWLLFSLRFPLFPALATIQPLVSTFTHPWLRFSVFLALFITYPTLGFSLFATLDYYSALFFFFLPSLVIILPLVFSSTNP